MPTRLYYLLEPMLPAWLASFALLARKPHWTWRQAVGLALILYPLIKMGFGIYYSIGALVTNPVLQPIPSAVLWRLVYEKLLLYLAVPVLGILIFFERVPYLEAPPEVVKDGAPGMLGAAGVRAGRGLLMDAFLGCALFIPILLAYAGAFWVAAQLSGGAGIGNERFLWQNLTPVLALLLAFVAGVTEEFLFRGLLFRHLADRMPVWAAALAQAVLFGFVHAGYGNWAHVVGPAIFGLAMAYVTLRMGLGAAVFLHMGINVVVFGHEVLLRDPGNPLMTSILLAFVGANIAALFVFRLEPLKRLWPWSPLRARLPDEKGAPEASAPVVPGSKVL